jgi:hypothetical protein
MKKLLLSAGIVLILATLAFAQKAETTAKLKGYIIDNLCAGTQTSAQLEEFVKTHSKGCALAPECQSSGYSIYAEHNIYKFDEKSNAMIIEFLKKSESKLLVEVEVKKSGNMLSLISIK